MTGNAIWRTSSYSGGSGGDCVEVRDDTGHVLVRDTKDRTGPVLPFTPQAWQRFTDRMKRSLADPQAKHPRTPLRLEGARQARTGLLLVPSHPAHSAVICRGFACSSLPCAKRTVVPEGQAGIFRSVPPTSGASCRSSRARVARSTLNGSVTRQNLRDLQADHPFASFIPHARRDSHTVDT